MGVADKLEKKVGSAVNVAKQRGVPDDEIISILDKVKSQVKTTKWIPKIEEGS